MWVLPATTSLEMVSDSSAGEVKGRDNCLLLFVIDLEDTMDLYFYPLPTCKPTHLYIQVVICKDDDNVVFPT